LLNKLNTLFLILNLHYVNEKMKARVLKKKIKGVDLGKLSDVMGMLFTNSAKNMDTMELICKYQEYRQNLKKFLENVIKINSHTNEYEPKLREFIALFMVDYKKYMSLNINELMQNNSEESLNILYDTYDAFKASPIIKIVSIITSSIRKSGLYTLEMKGEKIKKYEQKPYDAIIEQARNGKLILNVFTNVMTDCDVPYDFGTVFHSCIDIKRETKQQIVNYFYEIHQAGCDIYKLVVQPDIPIDKIFSELINGLKIYKSRIRNADKLFDLLEKKSMLFKNNFMKYYRSSYKDNNPMLILTGFLEDVGKDTSVSDVNLLSQCKTLTGELRREFNKSFGGKFAGNENVAKVNTLIDFITEYIEQNKDLEEAEDDDATGELAAKFADTFKFVPNS
jgi:hypothetical protein